MMMMMMMIGNGFLWISVLHSDSVRPTGRLPLLDLSPCLLQSFSSLMLEGVGAKLDMRPPVFQKPYCRFLQVQRDQSQNGRAIALELVIPISLDFRASNKI